MTDLVVAIASATRQQSSGIGQVNQAVLRIDQMTQHNVAFVEQSAGAAQRLDDQAARLLQAVAAFRLGTAAAAAGGAAPAALPA